MTRRLCDWLMGWGALLAGTAILILIGWASLAWGQEAVVCGANLRQQCIVTIEPCREPGCVALVTIRNINVGDGGGTRRSVSVSFTDPLTGATVGADVEIDHLASPLDPYLVTPWPGTWADPPSGHVADGEAVTIRLRAGEMEMM